MRSPSSSHLPIFAEPNEGPEVRPAGERAPTPEQIAQRAAILRQLWSHAEHYRRAGKSPPAWAEDRRDVRPESWTPPGISAGGLE